MTEQEIKIKYPNLYENVKNKWIKDFEEVPFSEQIIKSSPIVIEPNEGPLYPLDDLVVDKYISGYNFLYISTDLNELPFSFPKIFMHKIPINDWVIHFLTFSQAGHRDCIRVFALGNK